VQAEKTTTTTTALPLSTAADLGQALPVSHFGVAGHNSHGVVAVGEAHHLQQQPPAEHIQTWSLRITHRNTYQPSIKGCLLPLIPSPSPAPSPLTNKTGKEVRNVQTVLELIAQQARP
jgi:hypothetical protein